jgi:hypothetical protein
MTKDKHHADFDPSPRDLIAIAAMMAILRSDDERPYAFIAQASYRMAAAMVAERDRLDQVEDEAP